MITIQDLSYDLGGRFLYKDANWQINYGEHIGLVGKNGTGKSTLLRLITRQLTPTEGSITYAKNLKIGFLNQDLLSFKSDEPILNVAMQAFDETIALEAKINQLLDDLHVNPTDENILHELSEAQEQFELQGGYEMEARCYEVLGGLGFSDADTRAPFDSFSGGWRMRVMLAQMLLRKPDILLLDEPTNHLDLPSIQWVENYMQSFKGTYIIVSHDRYFLDLVVNKIVEISHQKLHFYEGNYSKYLLEREERRVIQQAAYENQQQYIREQERFIERFKAKASKATQAQSRVKMLEKLDRVDAPESDEAGMVLKFHVARKSGIDVVKLKHINKSFGEKLILKDGEGLIQRGDKIGLIGANGMGKSTLLRIIVGTEPHEGQVIHGHNVEATFFAQHQLEALDIKQTIWEEVYKSAPNKTDAQVRAILGCFLFSGDDVHKKIQVLSGGEKSRVALAKTLLQEANFLMLDEPTNHLDMQSIQILMEALKNYEGTFIVVSHDRYFLSEICNKIWYIENTKIKEYPGTYEEYDYWRKQNPSPPNAISKSTAKAEPKPVAKAEPKVDDSKKINQLKNQLKKVEEQLEKLENQKKKLEEEMAKPSIFNDAKVYANIQTQYNTLMQEIKSVTETWEQIYLALEEII